MVCLSEEVSYRVFALMIESLDARVKDLKRSHSREVAFASLLCFVSGVVFGIALAVY